MRVSRAIPFSRSARLLIVMVALGIAAIVALEFCQWVPASGQTTAPRLFGWGTQFRFQPDPRDSASEWHTRSNGPGLFARNGVSLNTAVFAGLVLPVVLIGGALVFILQARHRDRVLRGECALCGHPRGSGPRCPECGAC